MKRKTRNLLLSLAAIVLLAAMTCGGAGYYLLFYPQFRLTDYTYLYIDNDDTQDSVICKLNRLSPDAVLTGFQCLAHRRRYAENIHTGRYRINPGDIVFGDIDGVVIIPRSVEAEVIEKAYEKATGENFVAEKIRDGLSAVQSWARYKIM